MIGHSIALAVSLVLPLTASAAGMSGAVKERASNQVEDQAASARLRKEEGGQGSVELAAQFRIVRAQEGPRAGGPRAPHLIDFLRAGDCAVTGGNLATPDRGLCGAAGPPPECEEGATLVQPLWRRDRMSESSSWGPWEKIGDWSCAAPGVPTDFTTADFQRLPLAPPGIRVQPATPDVLVNMPTITMADAPEQTFATTLLGTQVEVRAAPSAYTWDYGDGSKPVTTTSPGHPYPDHDVHHTYEQPGTFTITLTVTWTGQWRVGGTSAWLPVQGTATTSASHTPITAVEARARLVAEDCITNPDGWGC